MDFATIKTEVEKTHERTDSKVTTRSGTWVNETQREICRRHNFSWMRTQATWATTTPYTTGTVDVTNDSATVTGTGTLWVTAGIVFGALFKGPDGLLYTVLAVDSETQLRLATTYQGGTAVGQTYSVYKRTFNLPANFKDENTVWLHKKDGYIELRSIDRLEAIRRYQPDEKGAPEAYLLLGTQFELWPAPDVEYLIRADEFDYLADLSGGGETNRLTIEIPEILIAGAVERAFKFIGELQESGVWKGEYERHFKQLIERDTIRQLGGEPVLAPRADVEADPNQERSQGVPVRIANAYSGGSAPSWR